MLHNPRHGRVGGRGSDDEDSPALREPDVVDAHRHGLAVAERVREAPAHDRHVQRIDLCHECVEINFGSPHAIDAMLSL